MRLRIRTLLLLIAIVALLIGTWTFGQRRGALLYQASVFAQQEADLRKKADEFEDKIAREKNRSARPPRRYESDTEAEYQARVVRLKQQGNQAPDFNTAAWKAMAAVYRKQADQVGKKKARYQSAANRPWMIGTP